MSKILKIIFPSLFYPKVYLEFCSLKDFKKYTFQTGYQHTACDSCDVVYNLIKCAAL